VASREGNAARASIRANTVPILRLAAPGVDELRAQVGVPRDPTADRLAHAPFFTSTPAMLEEPWNRGPAWIQRFRGVSPAEQETDGERLVYVSFGSVAPRSGFFPELYRGAIDALAELDARVLVGVGMQNDPSDLAPLPPDVHAQRWFDDRVLLGRLAAIVHHAGFGTTLGAAAAGVPAVVVPLFGDQPYNAARIHALGAGIALDGASGLGGLGDAVRRVLDEPGYRAAAGRVAAAVRDLPPVGEAVDALLAVARLQDLAA